MTQGERVRKIRRSSSVNLTMEKFGEKIGLKKSAISLIESGRNSLTDSNVKNICREFGVDYRWLTTGEGDMFPNPDVEFLAAIDRIMHNESDSRKDFFKLLVNLSDDEVNALNSIFHKYMEIIGNRDKKED